MAESELERLRWLLVDLRNLVAGWTREARGLEGSPGATARSSALDGCARQLKAALDKEASAARASVITAVHAAADGAEAPADRPQPSAEGETQWAVFWGGHGPDDAAGWDICLDAAEAFEEAAWRVEGGVAKRTASYGPWHTVSAGAFIVAEDEVQHLFGSRSVTESPAQLEDHLAGLARMLQQGRQAWQRPRGPEREPGEPQNGGSST